MFERMWLYAWFKEDLLILLALIRCWLASQSPDSKERAVHTRKSQMGNTVEYCRQLKQSCTESMNGQREKLKMVEVVFFPLLNSRFRCFSNKVDDW